jgi:hypothetical protein
MDIVYLINYEKVRDTHLHGLGMQIGELFCSLEAHYIYGKDKQNPIMVFRTNMKLGVSVTFRLSKNRSLYYNARTKEIKVGGGSLTFTGNSVNKVLEWLDMIEKTIPEGYVFEPYTEMTTWELQFREMLKNNKANSSS